MKPLLIGLALLLPLSSINRAAPVTPTVASTPLQAVMVERNLVDQEPSNLSLTQTLNRAEGATEAVVTLIESNLLDDAIAAVKNVYFLSNDGSGWVLNQTHNFQKCRRGDQTERFTQKRCP